MGQDGCGIMVARAEGWAHGNCDIPVYVCVCLRFSTIKMFLNKAK